MDRSFWIHILFKHANPEDLYENVLVITHSILLDLGFIPVKSIKGEDDEIDNTLDHTCISEEFGVPINSRDDSISMELLPSNWRSKSKKNRLFYISKICSKKIEKVIPELIFDLNSSETSVQLSVKSNLIGEAMKLEFPFKISENYSSNESLMFELSGLIRNEIDGFFNRNKIYNNNSKINIEEGHKIPIIKCEPLLETERSFEEYIGNNFRKSVDPLIDSNGVRGSLVGPESIIFKNQPKIFGKPKNIPISSIPGGTTIPDNDMFFPPGNNNSNYMFNFRE
ncbi:hypothetical protein [Cryptosporidium parvum Iowa II]|uniref:PI31 proteasome regulator N-terminal domain-containing protein n=2 Tax=Cryptosporidium parvum TaxID=5807 RepID=Q5CSL9_CRYPI|nr:hypothetical protein [Cryptosporidium parvum Iowa II]EAK88393.1 hypothetical protein cgd1_2140 [Cryptosporidium parvum Iowa II]QOY43414.1 Uncharacterized protein CPATCC_0037210 [Cryptosporidium parvum]WKS76114.1 hypothetical protein CPCDC_1g2140 [Cryptosporidium sp. 43IA8]WRK30606.1 Uncharacterized protein cpbgf_1002140 [Cryptosporidium parvum]|eukprot:QOY43414.1 hypothetical protein CPATCC_000196 [Cryptosporidium parvum]